MFILDLIFWLASTSHVFKQKKLSATNAVLKLLATLALQEDHTTRRSGQSSYGMTPAPFCCTRSIRAFLVRIHFTSTIIQHTALVSPATRKAQVGQLLPSWNHQGQSKQLACPVIFDQRLFWLGLSLKSTDWRSDGSALLTRHCIVIWLREVPRTYAENWSKMSHNK